jgi:hypothetical protein
MANCVLSTRSAVVRSEAAPDADRSHSRVSVAGVRATILHQPLLKKILLRRANHRHIYIIAAILEPARETAAGFLNRTAAAFGTHHLPCQRIAARRVCKRAAVRALDMGPDLLGSRSTVSGSCRRNFAGTRERAGTRRGLGPRSQAASVTEIGFAPEMTVSIRPCRIFHSHQERSRMTACLISRALVGLVTIAVWEGFS